MDDPLLHVDSTLDRSRQALLASADGDRWRGWLASSALSTATAVLALHLADPRGHASAIRAGLDWLCDHPADGGGFGDTSDSPANLATSALAAAALHAAGSDHPRAGATLRCVSDWLDRCAQVRNVNSLARALAGRYGRDRTFAVPILTGCLLAGWPEGGDRPWAHVPALPMELGVLSHRTLRRVRLPVVSYALPALIAMGLARHHHRPSRNPFVRGLRALACPAALRRLQRIQPDSGGYLEAIPLTAFVAMALISTGRGDAAPVARGLAFLRDTQRPDGSWPIDTDLSNWVTHLAIRALAGDEATASCRDAWRGCILDSQLTQRHPYTDAPAGGWAWTPRSGGVPDADDTAGALLALRAVADATDPRTRQAATDGLDWLTGLQNPDGGVPTFCRGWGRLDFDRSAPDLTAHAAAAMATWQSALDAPRAGRVQRSLARMIDYLRDAQQAQGQYLPLWFGHQHSPDRANPTYGTGRVLTALCDLLEGHPAAVGPMATRSAGWLLAAQRADGGWGGNATVEPSIEETAVAVEALARATSAGEEGKLDVHTAPLRSAVRRGVGWLVTHTDRGRAFPSAPIGLYFARLWYSEALYPVIFTVSALRSARHFVASR